MDRCNRSQLSVRWRLRTSTGPYGEGVTGFDDSDIDRGVNIGLEVTLIVIVCVAVIRGGYDLWRLSGAAGR
jgi:hypothetical protein